MKRCLSILLFVCLSAAINGQSLMKAVLTRQENIDLLKSLSKKLEDTTRIDTWLRLAEYNLWKDGDEKTNLDSAATFLRNAKELNAKQISRKRDAQIVLWESSLTRKSGNPNEGRQLVNEAIRQLKAQNDEFHLLQAYLELSRCYNPSEAVAIKNVFNTLFQRVPKLIAPKQVRPFMDELISFYVLKMRNDSYELKLYFLERLVLGFQLVHDKVNEFWTRKEIADIHYQQGKLDFAISELLQIAKEQKAGAYARMCYTYDLLSGFYAAAGQYDKALYYSLESIKYIHTEMDSAYLSYFYQRVASNYSMTGSIAEAVEWNCKRLNYLVAIKKTEQVYNIILDITTDLVRLHRPQEALDLVIEKRKTIVPHGNWEQRAMLLSLAQSYAAVKNHEMAEKYCQELIKLNELRIQRKEITRDEQADYFLASFYLKAGQYDNAERFFKKVLADRPGGELNTSILSKSIFLFKLDSGRGKYLSAIRHLQDYHKANDSIFTFNKTKQIEELKVVYATEQKDSLISFKEQNIRLLTKQDELQKSKLRQGAVLRNISFAVAALLIIIVALLFNRYRLKQRTNKKLESQQNEIRNQNLTLKHLVNEKDWLLKEIHHRVKNNLQIVMSLLDSQSMAIDNDAALTAIHDSQHRVHAMSLIHQKLYNTENVSSIDISNYISELVMYLRDSFNAGQRIRFDLAVEPIQIDVSHAVPLGLILNEAITNIIKYAFPDERGGTVEIVIKKIPGDRLLLGISDDGIGLPPGFDTEKKYSFGMNLIRGLVSQLEGTIDVVSEKGLKMQIEFPYKNADTFSDNPPTISEQNRPYSANLGGTPQII